MAARPVWASFFFVPRLECMGLHSKDSTFARLPLHRVAASTACVAILPPAKLLRRCFDRAFFARLLQRWQRVGLDEDVLNIGMALANLLFKPVDALFHFGCRKSFFKLQIHSEKNRLRAKVRRQSAVHAFYVRIGFSQTAYVF